MVKIDGSGGHQKGISSGGTRPYEAARTGMATSTDGLCEWQSDTSIHVHTEEVTGSIPVSPTSTGRRPGGIGYARFKERQNGRKQAR